MGLLLQGKGAPRARRTTADIRTMIETGFFGWSADQLEKKNDEDHNATKEEVLSISQPQKECRHSPYGMLRVSSEKR